MNSTDCRMYSSVASEGTPVVMLLPALRGLRTRLIPRRTREKPSSAFAHPIADHNCNTSHWVKVLFFVVPISIPFIMHSPPCRSNCLLLLECSQSLPQGLWLYFILFFFWTAHQDLSCALVPVPSLRHSSFFYNLHDCTFLPLQSFLLLSSADPTFSFRESVPPRDLPLIP